MGYPYIHIDCDGKTANGHYKVNFGTPVRFETGLGGIFGSWNWNGEMLQAEVDPYGMFSLFYTQTSNGIMLSTSPIQLLSLGAPSEIDETALTVFHLLGWYINEDTPFKHIKVLPPAARLTWCNGKLSILGRKLVKSKINIDRTAAILEYERLFSAAIRSCWQTITDPVIIPLSGGRDSRHILLESTRQGYVPDHCVTYDPTFGHPSAYDPEWACAKQITELVNIKHEKIKTLQSRHADQLRTIYLSHLGTDEHVQFLALSRHLAGKTFLDGIGGDTLSRNKNISTDITRAKTSSERVTDILSYFDKVSGNSIRDRILGLQVGDDAIEHARLQIVACYDKYSEQPDPYSHFFFWQRTRREIGLAPGAMLSSAKHVLCPYLDPALVEFCLALPDEITADGKFHDHVIRHSFPEVDIPYHDQFKPILPAPPLTVKAYSMADAVLSKFNLGVLAMAKEPFSQVRMLVDRRYKGLHFWRTYHEVILSLGDRKFKGPFCINLNLSRPRPPVNRA